jgi:hypothetical protein
MADPGQELSSINFSNMIGSPLSAVIKAQAEAAQSTINFIKSVGFKEGDASNPEATSTGEPIYVAFRYPKLLAPAQAAKDFSATVVVTNAGTNYTSPPTVAVSGGNGSGMTAIATLDESGGVASVAITSPGTGYTSPPTVALTGGAGTGATAVVNFVPPTVYVPAQIQKMEIEVPILAMLPIPCIRIEEFTLKFNAKIDSMEYQRTDTSTNISGNLQVRQRWPSGSAQLNVSASHQRSTTQGTNVQRSYALEIYVKAVQDELPSGLEKVLGLLERSMIEKPAIAQ